MKRLRQKFGVKIRFYHCGEYGEQLSRPHYHACLFGVRFEDQTPFGEKTFTSKTLTQVWGKGHCLIGDLTYESAAYVARYCTKVVTGDSAVSHYEGRLPEYSTMSRRPGIGYGWYQRFSSDVYPSDFLVVRGAKCKPPRYYDNLLKKQNEIAFENIREKRMQASSKRSADQTCRRLLDREICKKAQIKSLKRSYENET